MSEKKLNSKAHPFSPSSGEEKINHDSIRISTFNVLSSHLSSPTWFTACRLEDLDPETRYVRMLGWLEDEIKLQTIICLQEISQDWVGKLHVYFSQRGYKFIHSTYGSFMGGYMGNGIAWDDTHTTLVDAHLSTLSDDWTQCKETDTYEKMRQRFNEMVGAVNSCVSEEISLYFQNDPDYNWQIKRRKNTMISLKFRKATKTFWVATYHMPCAFTMPEVMNVYASLSAQKIQALAGTDPCVLAGDFNLKPKEPGYYLIREGGIGHYQLPPLSSHWSPKLNYPMRSAYKEFHGTEPDFTNWSVVKDGLPFIDTLDYIFLSREWDIVSVPALPTRFEVCGPLPNASNPSDHLPLSVVLTLLGK